MTKLKVEQKNNSLENLKQNNFIIWIKKIKYRYKNKDIKM